MKNSSYFQLSKTLRIIFCNLALNAYASPPSYIMESMEKSSIMQSPLKNQKNSIIFHYYDWINIIVLFSTVHEIGATLSMEVAVHAYPLLRFYSINGLWGLKMQLPLGNPKISTIYRYSLSIMVCEIDTAHAHPPAHLRSANG